MIYALYNNKTEMAAFLDQDDDIKERMENKFGLWLMCAPKKLFFFFLIICDCFQKIHVWE